MLLSIIGKTLISQWYLSFLFCLHTHKHPIPALTLTLLPCSPRVLIYISSLVPRLTYSFHLPFSIQNAARTMTKGSPPATFIPALIIHGGAGNIQRSTLPPDLYAKHHDSLLSYIRSTKDILHNGATALDATVHAVSLLEDDELWNCGRGSVFTSAGTIEMEASVMVTSVHQNSEHEQQTMKQGASVIGLKNVRNPIRLARESLLRTGIDTNGQPNGDGGSMHPQLVAPYIEGKAREWGLESKPDDWFWTQKRWEEHRCGLKGEKEQEPTSLSQGTVGCVCLDQWGNLATATSTGGMTNKWPGRIGDTPTLGAGFWAESWDVAVPLGRSSSDTSAPSSAWDWARDVWPSLANYVPVYMQPTKTTPDDQQQSLSKRRAVALSGTGNGDSFLRVAAARMVSAILRLLPSSSPENTTTLSEAISAIAGPGGELERSAGRRFGVTGEGDGGIIGIEAEGIDVGRSLAQGHVRRGKVVFNFNCGGMWRAWVEENKDGKDVERVMVFRDEYR